MGKRGRIVVIGGGFGGLAAAYELSCRGIRCTLIERDTGLGGLAGTFRAGELELEKFYHHWFSSDTAILQLIDEMGLSAQLIRSPTNTGSFYANSIYRLSTPWDLLKFAPLPLISRLRTGWMTAAARLRRDYRPLEALTAAEWVQRLAGKRAYEVMWRPLLEGKFGPDADSISAVWLWGKFKLRGGSRDRRQRENLIYMQGGFGRLISALRQKLVDSGVEIRTSAPVRELLIENNRIQEVRLDSERIAAETVVVTTQLPDLLTIAAGLPDDYRQKLSQIRHYGLVCLVLLLDRSLSETYWLNVNDPGLPFVGIIEHTNLLGPEHYGGHHVAYVPKYVPSDAELFRLGADELFERFLPGIQRIFPEFQRGWIRHVFAWRTPYAQPLIPRYYSRLRPDFRTPVQGLWLSTMAQVYPEDRGTNYAVAYGRHVASLIADSASA